MELQILNNQNGVVPVEHIHSPNDEKFITAKNTIPITLQEVRGKHIIPVFVKDNVPLVSQADFITSAKDIVQELSGYNTANLAIRVSHPIKGRTFEARNKKAAELLEHEKTIYYERMAFSFDIPDIFDTINGQQVTLSVIGVKAYNLDNLYAKEGSLQHFKIGIGYKVKVCTNLCLWTDGTSANLSVRNLDDLTNGIYDLVNQSNFVGQIDALKQLGDYELSEEQFANLLGRTRMYNHLPKEMKKQVPELLISDSQISTVTRAYYGDEDFKRAGNGAINLWNLYNLFTHAVKSSYIDTFIDRNLNAYQFTKGIADALENESPYSWFLN